MKLFRLGQCKTIKSIKQPTRILEWKSWLIIVVYFTDLIFSVHFFYDSPIASQRNAWSNFGPQ